MNYMGAKWRNTERISTKKGEKKRRKDLEVRRTLSSIGGLGDWRGW